MSGQRTRGSVELPQSYVLVISEKPDAALRISEALAQGAVTTVSVQGTRVHSFSKDGEQYVVCAALGHLYGVSETIQERNVYPVFDLEWFPIDLVEETRGRRSARASAIAKLAMRAKRVVNACDFDAEGETIGYNILRYACGMEGRAQRARFSTLTDSDLTKAFAELSAQGDSLAAAGRARHAIDFAWGVNLSRALSQSRLALGLRYQTISMGRVQGPALRYVVEKEREIAAFVPKPFWRVEATFDKDGERFTASTEHLETEGKAKAVEADCVGAFGVVQASERSIYFVGPPPPFNTGDLQREAFAFYRIPPSRALQTAERLYLAALISYPRTDSQKLPSSIGYRRILLGLEKSRGYGAVASEVLRGALKPVQGQKFDPAHPAVYPTGELPRRPLDKVSLSVYDLIVRRFLASFGAPAKRLSVRLKLDVNGHSFAAESQTTLEKGWLRYYGRYSRLTESKLPQLAIGEKLTLVGVQRMEGHEPTPARYTQASLLQRMESEGIGTKATRADTIATLIERGYVVGDPLAPSELGVAVVELMEKYAPEVVSTELTRSLEESLDRIGRGEDDGKELLRKTFSSIADEVSTLKAREAEVGSGIGSAAGASPSRDVLLGQCPVCRSGMLRVVRSRKTGKRFVGCTNYAKGCRASGPLPQRGSLRPTKAPCKECGWPVVSIPYRGRPWKLCVNGNCPTKRVKS